MSITRRSFLNASLVTSAATVLVRTSLGAAEEPPTAGRDYYELRSYRLKPGASPALLHSYLEKALLPALDRCGVKPVGVFTEIEIDRKAATSTPKPDSPVWVLMPHASLDSFVKVSTQINTDPAVRKAGADYLDVPKATPAFERIDSWLYLAFTGMPRLAVPAFSASRVATRVFEMRDYESHSELKALNKIAMFNAGEIDLMKELGMSPVFYGQGLAGPNLPHLRYVTSAPDLATHFANWQKFGPNPVWEKLKNDPQYADNTSKTGPSIFLAPTAYSAI
jgi:hypothetical protein